MQADRDESGRGNPMEATITASVIIDGEKLEDEVTIKQIEGDTAYNVVKQEYEDVKLPVSPRNYPYTVESKTLVSGFSKSGNSKFYDLISAGNWDYQEKYGLWLSSLENGIDEVTASMRKKGWNFQFDFNSVYRNPAHNRALFERGLRPAGTSSHILGGGTDIDISGLSNQKAEELYKSIVSSDNFSGFKNVGSLKEFKRARNASHVHINWF